MLVTMGLARPTTTGDLKSAVALAENIMERRERLKDDPRAWFGAFPDVEDPLAVVRFVGAHPHPVSSRACEDVEDALAIVQMLRQESEDSFKLAELAVIEVGHARKMEWDAIGKAMGFKRNRRQQAFTTHKRLLRWYREFELRQTRRRPRVVADLNDPMQRWRTDHARIVIAMGRNLLAHEELLSGNPDVADSLEMLAESLDEVEQDGLIGPGLTGILCVLSDECDQAGFGRLGGPVAEVLDTLRAFTRTYRQADRHPAVEGA